MADTRDLKSLVKYLTCGFESRSWHFLIRTNRAPAFFIHTAGARILIECARDEVFDFDFRLRLSNLNGELKMKKLAVSCWLLAIGVALATGAWADAATIDVAQANFAQNRTLKGSNLYRFTGSITFTAAAGESALKVADGEWEVTVQTENTKKEPYNGISVFEFFSDAACTTPVEENDPSALFIRASLRVLPAGE